MPWDRVSERGGLAPIHCSLRGGGLSSLRLSLKGRGESLKCAELLECAGWQVLGTDPVCRSAINTGLLWSESDDVRSLKGTLGDFYRLQWK